MSIPLYQVDAFADRPFEGNPAAVCLLSGPAEERWMQLVAREMNLSETAFLFPEGDGYRLRWFTPRVEVDLCGHATLASAHVLWESGSLKADAEARFYTRSGLLTARQSDGWITMDFPAKEEEAADAPDGLSTALGAQPLYVGRNQFDYIVEVASEEVVCGLTPDFAALASIPMRGLIVTSAATTNGFDFVSRFFAPGVGLNEDPVTGSAHCCLGPYWARKLGKSDFVARQVSERGGTLTVKVAGDRVEIAGKAHLVFRGELTEQFST